MGKQDLKAFLKWLRTTQPDKDSIRQFFQDRLLEGDLGRAVLWALREGERRGYRFTWLCVTHKGVRRVNEGCDHYKLRYWGSTASNQNILWYQISKRTDAPRRLGRLRGPRRVLGQLTSRPLLRVLARANGCATGSPEPCVRSF